MRILQLHNHHSSLGGAMEVLAHEALLLGEAGHAVRTFALPSTDELGLSAVRAGVKAVWNVEACGQVAAHVREFNPDVVHVHTPFPLLSPAVFRTAKRLGVATVTTLHSYRYSCIAATCHRDGAVCEDCVGKKLKLPGLVHRCYHDSVGASGALTLSLGVHRAVGTLHRAVDRYLALTDFSRRLLIRDGIPADKVVVKPNSVPDPGVGSGRSAQRYVFFAGRLMTIKGVETMLEAWARADTADMGLRIAGDGELRTLVEQHAAQDPTITFDGWVDEDVVYDLMGGATAVIVPSEWYEGGGPLVVLRSLAVGTPVVVSNLDNISEAVLADDAGEAFAVGDPAALAEVFTRMAADDTPWEARRGKARDSYDKRYSPTVDIQRLETLYAEVTGLPGLPSASHRPVAALD